MPSIDTTPGGEVRIEYLTSPEIGDAVAAGYRTAILPLAAIEQHGGHLPLSVDADHADELAVLIARRLGDALVLPTVRVGYSPHHLEFAGTLSLRASTLESICVDYTAHLAQHGFERVILFSGHIGNYSVMRDFESRLQQQLAPLTVIVFTDAAAILDSWRLCATRVAGMGDNVGGHADIAETSVMLVLDPGKVRSERFAPGRPVGTDRTIVDAAMRNGVHSVSPNGILGDPAGSCAAIGTACLETVSALIADYARERGA